MIVKEAQNITSWY